MQIFGMCDSLALAEGLLCGPFANHLVSKTALPKTYVCLFVCPHLCLDLVHPCEEANPQISLFM